MTLKINRREAMVLGITSVASTSFLAWADTGIVPAIVQNHDEKLKHIIDTQVTDPQSPWCGVSPDMWGLYHCGSAARILQDCAAAFFHPQSVFHSSSDIYERMKLAIGFLVRSQNDEGNIDLITTNFNSPPDTGFVVHNVALAAKLAQMSGHKDLLSQMKGFLRRAGRAMARGGIHTPNHRWVVCAALAQIHDLFPDRRYLKRLDQWLAEGIDIDAEGQFIERSTGSYNAVIDNAFVTMAHLLKRPELLDPVRKNLDAMAYLLHSNGEIVTEISNRQDSNTRRTMRGYWFALRYMAIRDGNGLYASMLEPLEPESIQLARLMAYPELQQDLSAATPIPEDYEKVYPLSGITRIRRGKTSVTIMHEKNSRWIAMRRGEAVINAVRFATAFFGKGQFVPTTFKREKDGYRFRQKMQACYYQPLTDPKSLPIEPSAWTRLKTFRQRTEICRLAYEGYIRETDQGFEITVRAHGTDNVPLALEINLREGGKLTGVVPAPHVDDAFLLKDGLAEYRMGSDLIRFGPGRCEHAYPQVRGAHTKLPGPSVYLTGYTPFEHTLTFQML